jgi:non-ribosomal peptide synthetase component F
MTIPMVEAPNRALNFSSQKILLWLMNGGGYNESGQKLLFSWGGDARIPIFLGPLMDFFESFFQNVRQHPQSVAVEDDGRFLTYADLDELSGKVYRYLTEKGVGREDVVLVRLPRCAEYYGCVLGIWKAGAVLLGMETDEPEEREKFIRKSGNPKLEIDAAVLESIRCCTPMEGYRPRDLHDAAFFVYTSAPQVTPRESFTNTVPWS